MPHWEVWEYIRGIHRINTLHQINYVSAGILSNPWYTMDDREDRIKGLYARTGLFPEMAQSYSSQPFSNYTQSSSRSSHLSLKEAMDRSANPVDVFSQIASVAKSFEDDPDLPPGTMFTAPCNDGKVDAPTRPWTLGAINFAQGGAGF